MKHIRLISLTMQNFRGERQRKTEFGYDRTEICGRNGLGKSRHFDAFLWLLFGKDSQGRKDYELKTRVNGEVQHGVDVTVEGTLDVEGEIVTMQRSLVENWVKPKGQTEAVYSGNKTVCSINGVPKSITQYNKDVFSIIDENLFLMLTNPSYFVNMPWQKQREQLMTMVGTVGDEELARNNLDFQDLLNRLNGKSVEDYRKEIAQKKRKTKEALANIQPRIDQTYSLMPEEERWDELETEIASVNSELEFIGKEISEEDKDCTKDDLFKKQSNIKAKISNIEYFAKKEAETKADKANSERRKIAESVSSLRLEYENKVKYANTLECEIKSIQNILENTNSEREDLRNQYRNLSKLTFSDHCPYCGQELSEKMKEDGYEKFARDIVEKKRQVNEKGFHLKERIDRMTVQLTDAENNLKLANSSKGEISKKIAAESKKLEDMPIVKPMVDFTEHEEYKSLQHQLECVQNEINGHKAEENPRLTELRQKKEERKAKLIGLLERMKNRGTIEKYKSEIEKLKSEAKRLAIEMASYEKDECTIYDVSIARAKEMKKRISMIFGDSISFCLYDKTLDGNLVETCYPLIHGVPYNAANTAAKINSGLSIINALCSFYDVSAPIFIDNAESVNVVNSKVVSQTILLKVTEDEKLIVK